jgi:hypothetical protein
MTEQDSHSTKFLRANEVKVPDLSKKATLVPVSHCDWQLPKETVLLTSELTFENVEGLLQPNDFDLWQSYVSEEERKKLSGTRFALMHRFMSPGHVGKEESDSQDLIYRAFICLRLIKPTKDDYSYVQFRILENKKVDVFSFSRENKLPLNLPESELFNQINHSDLVSLRSLIGPFLANVDAGPINFRRSLRHYFLAYSEVRDPVVQLLILSMCIEQFYAGDEGPLSLDELLARIHGYIGLDSNIYENSDIEVVLPNTEPVIIKNTIRDLFQLRNKLIHGQWVPANWLEITRVSAIPEYGNYADLLRSTASFVARKSLLRFLSNQKSIGK